MTAFRVFRRLRDLLDVDTTGAAVGDALVLDADGETWVPGSGGGGGGSDDQTAAEVSFTPVGTIAATDVQAAIEEVSGDVTSGGSAAVILAPASSARNVIQPTAGSVIAAVLKAHAAQSVDLLQVQTSAGVVQLAVDQLGRITSGAAVGAAVGAIDLNPSAAPVSATDVYGSTLPLSLGLRMIAEGTLAADTPTAQFQGLQAVMKGPTSDKTHGILFGADVATIFRGTKALAGAQQVSSLIGGRFAALDYDYTAAGDDATGTIYSILGVEPYASHGGQSSVNNVIAVAAYAEAQQLLGVTPGPVAGFITGVNSLIATDTSIGTLPAMYGFNAERTTFANTAITLAAAYYAENYGLTGTVDSYGLYIAAQSGSTNPYGIYVAGGKNVFVDGLLIAKTSAPADAYYANSQGGWWWDAANSVPKWKGKQAGGTVINFTPQAQDADLDTIAGLSPSNDDFLQRKAGAWANRTVAQVLTDLGLSALYQPLDSDLTAFAGLAIAADKLPYGTGSHTLGLTDFTAAGRALVDDADATAQRATLGLVIGTNVQAFDQDLTDIAALADPNADRILFWDDSAGAYKLLAPGTGLTITGTTIDASGGGLSSGTSFPGSPSNNDLYYRTDLDLLCFYDGTRWMTVTVYETTFGGGAGAIPYTATSGIGYLPTNSTYDMWLVDWSMTTFVLTTNDGSNNWTIKLQKTNAANTATDIDSFSTGTTPDTPTNWVLRQRSLGVLLGGSSTWKQLDLLGTKVGTGGSLYFGSLLRYRLVVT